MHDEIVFSDVDGTLLTSQHQLLANTLYSIKSLQQQGIPFVLISARSPSGIYPIQEKYGFRSPVISYSGALILDENRNVLYSRGFSRRIAKQVIEFIEENHFDCSWNLYSMDTWIVKDKRDPRVIREEEIVQACAVEGTVDMIAEDADIGKILCMCNPDCILEIEQQLKAAFPSLSIVKSSDRLLEIMQSRVTKSSAVKALCSLWDISLDKTVAFGDHYNDVEMLETVAMPFLMGNAPAELKKRFTNVTDSNDEDGIYHGLVKTGLIMARNISVRALNKKEAGEALSLVWNVFLEYEAPDYTEEGIQEFHESIHDEEYLSKLSMYGAFDKDKLIGVIATRSEGTHIALFFVDSSYHRQGVGRQLVQTIQSACRSNKMTVNSSPYAVPIYRKLGFYDVGKEQVVNGLRFTPMELSK